MVSSTVRPTVGRGARTLGSAALLASVASLAAASPSFAKPALVAPDRTAPVSGKIDFAAAGTGLRQATFLVDGRVRSIDRKAPFRFGRKGLLDTRTLRNGRHRLTLQAKDLRGKTTVLSRVITVRNLAARAAAADTTNPTVSWKAPALYVEVSGLLQGSTCEVVARDNVGISRVEFWIDGTRLNTETSAPYNCSFDSRKVANGYHQLKAFAFDARGNRKETWNRVEVKNSNSGTTAPAPSAPAPTAPAPTTTPAPTTPAPTSPTRTKPVLGGGTTYYVDSASGNDGNSGTSESSAWRSLAKASSASIAAGGNLLLKRGGSWTGTLTISESGTGSASVNVGAYGSGAKPRITYGNSGYDSGCVVVSGSYVVVQDLELSSCSPARNGIKVSGDRNVIQRLTVSRNQAAVQVPTGAEYNRMLENVVVDNNVMTVNNSGGDNDFGAYSFAIEGGSNNEFAFNTISGASAPSMDYGADGSAFEIYGGTGNHIHHNTMRNNQVGLEVGKAGTADNTFAYNVITSSLYRSTGWVIHGGGNFGPTYRTRAYNNTVAITDAASGTAWSCYAGCNRQSLILRNNIISAPKLAGLTCVENGCNEQVDTDYNIYHGGTLLSGRPVQGFGFGPNDRYADPGFTSSTDLSLRAGSAAINTGTSLAGYSFDMSLQPLVGTVDRGAYERP